MNSGISAFPHAGQTFRTAGFSSIFLISFLRFVISVFILSTLSLRGSISLASILMLLIKSFTCASVSLLDSTVSYIASSTSLLFSRSCPSTSVWVLASESIWLRKASTGLSKIIMQVIPQRMNVAAAVVQRYTCGEIAASFSLMNG